MKQWYVCSFPPTFWNIIEMIAVKIHSRLFLRRDFSLWLRLFVRLIYFLGHFQKCSAQTRAFQSNTLPCVGCDLRAANGTEDDVSVCLLGVSSVWSLNHARSAAGPPWPVCVCVCVWGSCSAAWRTSVEHQSFAHLPQPLRCHVIRQQTTTTTTTTIIIIICLTIIIVIR